MITNIKKYSLFIIFVISITLQFNCIVYSYERPNFSTYKEAKDWVRDNANFEKNTVDTSRSSFIRSAEYYRDTTGFGYLILNFKGKNYIWAQVPQDIWNSFKQADSIGKYTLVIA